MSTRLTYIIIHCQHRSGSTALLNTLGDVPGVYAIPEELNLVEPIFVRNTLRRYARNQWNEPTRIYGSIWTATGEFYHKTRSLINECREFASYDLGEFSKVVIDHVFATFTEGRVEEENITSVACKYVVHVGASSNLIQSFPSAFHIILVRDLGAIYSSKINDPQMLSLKRLSLTRYYIKRIAILVFFSLDYRRVKKLATSATLRPRCYVVRYATMQDDIEKFAKDAGLDFGSLEGIAKGKPSSMFANSSKPTWIEIVLLRLLGGRSYLG